MFSTGRLFTDLLMKCKYLHTGSTQLLEGISKEKLNIFCDMHWVRMNIDSIITHKHHYFKVLKKRRNAAVQTSPV